MAKKSVMAVVVILVILSCKIRFEESFLSADTDENNYDSSIYTPRPTYKEKSGIDLDKPRKCTVNHATPTDSSNQMIMKGDKLRVNMNNQPFKLRDLLDNISVIIERNDQPVASMWPYGVMEIIYDFKQKYLSEQGEEVPEKDIGNILFKTTYQPQHSEFYTIIELTESGGKVSINYQYRRLDRKMPDGGVDPRGNTLDFSHFIGLECK